MMSFDEIAQVMGLPTYKVVALYHRAMRKVRRAYEAVGIGPQDIVGKPQHALVRLENKHGIG